MYDPKVGRWLSADPIGFEAGDVNLYRYVENNVPDSADPAGLWKVTRAGGATAVAVSEHCDTIDTLAVLVGLNTHEFVSWMTAPDAIVEMACGPDMVFEDLNPTMDQLAKDQAFLIPNTMVSAWFGELGWLGRMWARWDEDNADLGKLGFAVATFNNDSYRHNDVERAENDFLRLVASHSQAKSLHGVYAMGHGTTGWFGSDGKGLTADFGPAVRIYYDDIGDELNYKLGALVVHACDSQSSDTVRLVSANGILAGTVGTHVPVYGTSVAAYWGIKSVALNIYVDGWSYGGAQATNTFTVASDMPVM